MFGISGVAFGAILRAYGRVKRERWEESYKDLLAVAGVWAGVVLVLSLVGLLLGTAHIETLLAWLPASITTGITTIGFGAKILVSLLAGVSAFASMFIGALVVDIAINIKESI